MKPGYDINDLVKKIKNDEEIKRDFHVHDTNNIQFNYSSTEIFEEDGTSSSRNTPLINLSTQNGMIQLEMNDTMTTQLANNIQLPKSYFDKCLQKAPDLLRDNVQHWFNHEPKQRLIRAWGDTGRAYLSNAYATIDNFDVLQAIVPIADKHNMVVKDSYITDNHMYMRCFMPNMTRDISKQQKGDIVGLGFLAQNSETGLGKIKVSPILERLVCLNGMTVNDAKYTIQRKHIGSKRDMAFSAEVYRNETIVQQDRAWLMTMEDEMTHLFNGQTFEEITDRIIVSQDSAEVERPQKAVEEITKKHKFSEMESEAILEALLLGGDRTKWGMGNAVTTAAKQCTSVDRSIEMESIGWDIVNMKSRSWEDVALAA